MSSTIILSSPEGPKELLTTLAIAWVARTTAQLANFYLNNCPESSLPTILISDIGAADFLSSEDCANEVSFQPHSREPKLRSSQSVPALRGCSKIPAISYDQSSQRKGRTKRLCCVTPAVRLPWRITRTTVII